eukprot:symbB.v1.2.006780.t1/scaffold396.1/size242164/7
MKSHHCRNQQSGLDGASEDATVIASLAFSPAVSLRGLIPTATDPLTAMVMAPRSQVAFAMKNARHDIWILWNRHAGIRQVASNILPSHWW